jgi:hypothetical protein
MNNPIGSIWINKNFINSLSLGQLAPIFFLGAIIIIIIIKFLNLKNMISSHTQTKDVCGKK